MGEDLKWIKHDGGPMPVPGGTAIAAYKLRDGYVAGNGVNQANFLEWGELGGSTITEYAIVTPSPSQTDTTNPDHYKQGDIECIDAIKVQLSPEQFKGYLKASMVKYVWRYEHKGAPADDLEKAKWFLERLISEVRDATD